MTEKIIIATGIIAIFAGVFALRLAIKAAAWMAVEGEYIARKAVDWWEAE